MLHLPLLFPYCFRSVFRFSRFFRFRFRFGFPPAFSVPFVLPFGVPVPIWPPFSFLFSLAMSSTIREKWKTQCVYCLFSGSELKTLCLASEPEKKAVNTLCFPLFREFGGSWIYRLRIRSGPFKIYRKVENTVFLLFIFRFRAQSTAFRLQNRKKNSKHTVFSTSS